MSQNMYPIQLLNDLHNHFPELLYNSRRFQTVQDVLFYIRSVADISPLQRGQLQYDNSLYHPRSVNNYRQNATTIPSYTSPIAPAPAPPIPVNNTIPQAFVTTLFEENIPSTRVRLPVNNNTNTNALINTLLGGLFGDILGTPTVIGGGPLQDFLNQRVSVYPTNDEIGNATTAFRASHRQEDICAICQDEIDIGQEVRRIRHCNHSFHRDCIDTWFSGNVHCPSCRHDIREIDQNPQTNQNNIPPPVPENHRRTNIRNTNDE